MNQLPKFSFPSAPLSPQGIIKMVSSSPYTNTTSKPSARESSVRQRVRLCLILKFLATTLDPVERVYLRMTIRQCVAQFRGSAALLSQHQQQSHGFDDYLELQIRRQVGDARWGQCEVHVDRLLATKNWNLASSSVLRLPQHHQHHQPQQGPLW